MAVSVVEIVSPETASGEVTPIAQVVEVVVGGDTPTITTALSESVVNVIQPGGTVVNVQYGFEFPENPYEGMIFIKLVE